MQNTMEVQETMIEELERNAPPLIVLDGEFNAIDAKLEPTDGSKSTGVTLLDDNLQSPDRKVETHGFFSIW